jgi:hypothetical protein
MLPNQYRLQEMGACMVRSISFPSVRAGHLALLVAVSMIYSIIIVSLDIHFNATYKANCTICKLGHDLSCGKKTALFLLPRPGHTQQAANLFEYAMPLKDFPVSSINTRGPPRFATRLNG